MIRMREESRAPPAARVLWGSARDKQETGRLEAREVMRASMCAGCAEAMAHQYTSGR